MTIGLINKFPYYKANKCNFVGEYYLVEDQLRTNCIHHDSLLDGGYNMTFADGGIPQKSFIEGIIVLGALPH